MFSVYVIFSTTSGKYYVGFTSDLPKRLSYHNTGKNKSTKSGVPWTLIREEKFESKKLAWLRERQIKSYKGGEAFGKLVDN